MWCSRLLNIPCGVFSKHAIRKVTFFTSFTNIVKVKCNKVVTSKHLWLTCIGGLCVKRKLALAHCSARLNCRNNERNIKQIDERSKKSSQLYFIDFLKFLLPDLWLLLLASLCAFGVAIVNVRLPLFLGELVNKVSSLSGQTAADYAKILKDPAKQLVHIYLAQGILTFVYISLLSSFGERLAARLRNNLFSSLVKQDVQFFDCHKTGELISR